MKEVKITVDYFVEFPFHLGTIKPYGLINGHIKLIWFPFHLGTIKTKSRVFY